MNELTHNDSGTEFATTLPGAERILLVTRDAAQLHGVDRSLREIPCGTHVVPSITDALNLNLEQFLAIVLDETSVGDHLPDILDQFISRAPAASHFVACEPTSRSAILTALATCTAEWILKPIDGDELVARLRRFDRHRRTRAELEDSLHFIQRVADATPEMLYLFDVQDEYTLYVNQQACSVLGCTPEGISAEGFMFFKSVVDPKDSEWVLNYLTGKLALARDGDIVQAEYRIRDRFNRSRWIHTREIVFHRDSRGHPKQILGSAQDITDRKELEQTQALLATIVASSDDAIVGKTLDGDVLSWNAGAERLYGYTEAEIVGQNISLLVPPEHCEEVHTILSKIRCGERVDHYQTLRRRKDGAIIQVSVTVSPILDGEGHVTGASTIARQM